MVYSLVGVKGGKTVGIGKGGKQPLTQNDEQEKKQLDNKQSNKE